MKHLKAGTLLGLPLFAMAALGGCAVNSTRGVVAMKIDDNTAHICVRKVETAVGDRFALYRNECARTPGPRPRFECSMKKIGAGSITELLNEHYALLTFDHPTEFKEGDLVEKESR